MSRCSVAILARSAGSVALAAQAPTRPSAVSAPSTAVQAAALSTSPSGSVPDVIWKLVGELLAVSV